MSSPLYLFRTRRFAPLFAVQFLGAFNDNLFKNTLVVILTFQASQWTAWSPGLLAPLIGGIFILPFFLFSALAGQLADRHDKAMLTRLVKLLEIGLLTLATAGFALHAFGWLLAVVFGLGLHSTLFGPIKYAIIPQHMADNELVTANALVEAGTFAAILAGTIGGGVLSMLPQGGVIAAGCGIVIALAGYAASRMIPAAPAADPQLSVDLNPLTQTIRTVAFARHHRGVFYAILAISWFWLYGALLLSQFPSFVAEILKGDERIVTLLLALFTVGIGTGSILCERLSAHTIRPSLIIVGAAGMALSGIDFAATALTFSPVAPLTANPVFWHLLADLTLIGVFGGFYSVPLYTIMQSRSDPRHRSRIIAANNILNALFMVGGAVMTMILLQRGWEIASIFLVVALMTGAVSLAIALAVRRTILT